MSLDFTGVIIMQVMVPNSGYNSAAAWTNYKEGLLLLRSKMLYLLIQSTEYKQKREHSGIINVYYVKALEDDDLDADAAMPFM